MKFLNRLIIFFSALLIGLSVYAGNYQEITNSGLEKSAGVNDAGIPEPPPPPPKIHYSPSSQTFTVGTAIGTWCPINTGGAADDWWIDPSLPSGLNFNIYNGCITGTPTAVSPYTKYTVWASNDVGEGAADIYITVITPPPLPPVIKYDPDWQCYYKDIGIQDWCPTNTGGAATSWSISQGQGKPFPSGLSFNTSTGCITGTPTTTILLTYYTVKAHNDGGDGYFQIKINIYSQTPEPVYTPTSQTFIVGTPITPWTPTEKIGTAESWLISQSLPAGLNFNTSNGEITGTPTAVSLYTEYTVTAIAGDYVEGKTKIYITVNPALPIPAYIPNSQTFTVGTAISPWCPTNTGGAADSWSISAPLPSGLSFNTSNGCITGTPLAVSSATNYTVSATNITGTGTTPISITVKPAPPIIVYNPSSQTFTVGTAISPWCPTNTGGAADSWSISAPLPSGLSFNTSNGCITGTPLAVSSATNYTVSATNITGTGTTPISITVKPALPIIVYNPSSQTFTVGTAISPWCPTNTGGAATSWSISQGQGLPFPSGLEFNTSNGCITGTPTVPSSATSYTVTASNAAGEGKTTISITVKPALLPPVPVYDPSSQTFTVGTAIGTWSPSNSGGAATSWLISPSLPSGLNFNTTNGDITGTPTVVSLTTKYIVTAHNAAGDGTTEIEITVKPALPIIVYNPSSQTFTVGTAIDTWCPTNTGGAAISWSISPSLPAGLNFNTSDGCITGTPTAVSPATNYTVSATNTAGTGTTIINITVVTVVPEKKNVLVGSWPDLGVWSWNPKNNSWEQFTNQLASELATGDLDGNGQDDMVGIYGNWGFWIRMDNGAWQKIDEVPNPLCIAIGDLNADGKDDIIGVWQGLGVWVRYSGSTTWAKLHDEDALMLACGDFDKDGKDDLLGVWNPEGIWIKYASGGWKYVLKETNLLGITAGDMNGDGQSDMLGNWTFGVWYYDFANSSWTSLYNFPAEKIAAGDLDGDKKDDLIGTWPNTPGLWVKYTTGTWYKIHDPKPSCFAVSAMKALSEN